MSVNKAEALLLQLKKNHDCNQSTFNHNVLRLLTELLDAFRDDCDICGMRHPVGMDHLDWIEYAKINDTPSQVAGGEDLADRVSSSLDFDIPDQLSAKVYSLILNVEGDSPD